MSGSSTPDWLAHFQAGFGAILREPLDRETGTLSARVDRYAPETVREIRDAANASAAARLAAHNISNVTLESGDAARGWDKHGPYDVIVLTGSVPVLPESFQQSLNPGGRLLAVTGTAPAMHAQLLTRADGGACSAVTLFETCIAPLKNALQLQRFVF